MCSGGRAKRASGGGMGLKGAMKAKMTRIDPRAPSQFVEARHKDGSRIEGAGPVEVPFSAKAFKKINDEDQKQDRMPRASGGKADNSPAAFNKYVKSGKPMQGKKFANLANESERQYVKKNPMPSVPGRLNVEYAKGGVIDGGTRPKGGRMARKGGGRTKKGMNVNIIIAPSQPSPPRPMMPPPAGAPPPGAGPMGMHAGAPPPVGPPQMPPPGAGMPRKDGGSVVGKFAKPGRYPLKNASGGAKGRLEKIRSYG
jgi:hypothetical protein